MSYPTLNSTFQIKSADLADLLLARDRDRLALRDARPQGADLTLSLLATTPDCVKLLTLDGALTFMSFGGLCAMEIDSPCSVVGSYWWDLWPAEESDRLIGAVRDAVNAKPSEFVAYCPTAKGSPRWWAVTVSPVLGQNSEVSQILAVSRDVTAMMQRQSDLESALAESEMLRKEVDHRVKNSLGLVSSMLNLHARNATDDRIRDALLDASMRVRTIASVHDKLYRARTDGVPLDDYLSSLCEDIQVSIGGAVRLEWSGIGTDLTVSPDVSLALGLIVAELAGNALKHAHLAAQDLIRVAIAQDANGAYVLSVHDSGCGLPADFSLDCVGMGMTVVQSMATKIGGTFGWGAPVDGGTVFHVTFQLPKA